MGQHSSACPKGKVKASRPGFAPLTFIEIVIPLRLQSRLQNGRLVTNLTLMATTLATLLLFNILLVSVAAYVGLQNFG